MTMWFIPSIQIKNNFNFTFKNNVKKNNTLYCLIDFDNRKIFIRL